MKFPSFELDILTEITRECEGVLGSRMTGAGFGGCTVSLIESDKKEAIVKTIGKEYSANAGLKARFFFSKPEKGVRKL